MIHDDQPWDLVPFSPNFSGTKAAAAAAIAEIPMVARMPLSPSGVPASTRDPKRAPAAGVAG